jgi:Putative addiction module component
MDRHLDRVMEEALALDESERAELVDRLRKSIQHRGREFEENLTEAKRRLEAYDRGEIESVDAREAMARIRKLNQ